MKRKKLLLTGLILLVPFISKASKLEDIKDIRGNKNYFEDLMLDNNNMYIDMNEFKKYKIDPKEYGVNIDSGKEIKIDSNKKENSSNKSSDNILDELSGKTFVFQSGAGGWLTTLNFKDGGNFNAEYTDADYAYLSVARIEGKFSVDKKVNDTSYILNLDKAKFTTPVGQKENTTIDGQNVEVSYTDLPYGFAKDNESDYSFQDKYTLYLPHRKRSEMSDEVNQWINMRGGDKHIDDYESRVFILVNNSTIDTFLEKIN